MYILPHPLFTKAARFPFFSLSFYLQITVPFQLFKLNPKQSPGLFSGTIAQHKTDTGGG